MKRGKRQRWKFEGRQTSPFGGEFYVWSCKRTSEVWVYPVDRYLMDTVTRCMVCGQPSGGKDVHWECERALLPHDDMPIYQCGICKGPTYRPDQHWECERDQLLTAGIAP